MKRKIMLIVGVSLLVVGVLYLVNNRFNSKAEPLTARLNAENQLKSTNLSEYLSIEPGEHVFFLDDGSSDASYIETSLIVPLSLEFTEALPAIEPISFIDSNLSVVSMKKNYKIDSLPAFVYLETTDEIGSFKVLSSLSYDKEKPFNIDDIRQWFNNNGLWNAPIANAN